MNITDVQIEIVHADKLKAYVNIVLDNALVVKNMKVVDLPEKGLMVSMPNWKNKQGSYQDLVHPINSQARKLLEFTVLNAYQDKLEQLRQNLNNLASSSPRKISDGLSDYKDSAPHLNGDC